MKGAASLSMTALWFKKKPWEAALAMLGCRATADRQAGSTEACT
jgi:hypothetical protein